MMIWSSLSVSGTDSRAGCQLVEDAVVVIPDTRVTGIEVSSKLSVVFEPPEGCLGEEQELLSLCPQSLKVRDRLIAVRRVMPGVNSSVCLREVARSCRIQLQQPIVA